MSVVSVDSVQRTSRQMLTGVVDPIVIDEIKEELNQVQEKLAELRVDIEPIASGDLMTNSQFIALLARFDEFFFKYGVEAKDLQLDLNPIYSLLQQRVDLIDNDILDVRGALTRVEARQNVFDDRLKVVERLLGVALS